MNFRLSVEEDVVEFLMTLPKRKSARIFEITRAIAANPYNSHDYFLPDADGREIAHVLTEGWLFSYRIDSAARTISIVEIEAD